MQTKSGPRHVGIIMDGNGRWAAARGLPRVAGHRQGVETLDRVIRWAREASVRWLSVYAFSTENWKRPAAEVEQLMALFGIYLRRKARGLREEGIRLVVSGERERLSVRLADLVAAAEEATRAGTAMTLNVCVSYGGREEVTRAARLCLARVAEGTLEPDAITADVLGEAFYQPAMPDLDLVVRTSGERRLSNFMMWQAGGAELHYTERHWPDFTREDFDQALAAFARRGGHCLSGQQGQQAAAQR